MSKITDGKKVFKYKLSKKFRYFPIIESLALKKKKKKVWQNLDFRK